MKQMSFKLLSKSRGFSVMGGGTKIPQYRIYVVVAVLGIL